MKTPEDVTEELLSIAKWNGVYNGEFIIHAVDILYRFEKEIRADQNKITRNDCGSEIASIEYHHQGMGCGLEDKNITDRYEAMEHGFDEAIEKSLAAILGE